MTAFQATYSDWKLIRTRRVVQIVLEVPVEQADQAYKVLGGMPLSGEETWVGVARLTTGGRAATGLGERNSLCDDPTRADSTKADTSGCPGSIPGPPHASQSSVKPVRAPIAPDKRLTQRAAILCNDPDFQLWLKKTNPAWRIMNSEDSTDEKRAAHLVRQYCGVPSRKNIVPGTHAAMMFDEMLGKYAAWQACLEEVS